MEKVERKLETFHTKTPGVAYLTVGIAKLAGDDAASATTNREQQGRSENVAEDVDVRELLEQLKIVLQIHTIYVEFHSVE